MNKLLFGLNNYYFFYLPHYNHAVITFYLALLDASEFNVAAYCLIFKESEMSFCIFLSMAFF